MAYQQESICRFCDDISCGRLQDVIKAIDTQEFACDVCTDQLAVFNTIKYYNQYLIDKAQHCNEAFSDIWKSEEVKKEEVREDVIKLLKLSFNVGFTANKSGANETPLMIAIGTHDEEIIRVLLENSADPNLFDNRGKMNALALAVILNEVPVIKLLLSYGAKINEPCCCSMTPLHLALNKSGEVSKLLFQNGADIHQVLQASNDDTVVLPKPPLIHAVETNNLYLTSILLEHGEDINQSFGECSNSPIHMSIVNGNEDMVKLLIQFGANLNKRNGRGCTPLGLALNQPGVGRNICYALLNAGCSWRKRSMIRVFQRLYPPFHIASFLGHDFHLEFLQTLLERSKESVGDHMVKPNENEEVNEKVKTKHSRNLSNSETVVDLTRSEDELVNLQALDNSSALFMSVLGGNLDIAELLFQKGADPLVKCSYGNLFHAAVMASKQTEEMLKFAFKFQLDINAFNDDGNTPLILAARNSNPKICEMLIQHGTRLNVMDRRFGETSLSASVYFGCEANAETLICHGADPDIPDVRGTTALYWAIFNARERTLKLLLEAGVKLTSANLARYPRNIKVMRNPEVKLMLQDYISQPSSLQQCCRLCIRKKLVLVHDGRSIIDSVMSLPVPYKLRQFISLMAV